MKPRIEPLTLTRRQAAQLLGISVVSLDRLTKAGRLHPCRVLKKLLFLREDLIALLHSGKGEA
jgi:hypothetical protein